MSAQLPFLILLGVGLLTAIAGGIILLISAFRQSVGWGLITLFVPMGNIIFTCVHWAEARVGFLTNLAGVLLCVGAVFAVPETRAALKNGTLPLPASLANVTSAKGAAALTPQQVNQLIMDKRQALESQQAAFVATGRQLRAEFTALENRRQTLVATDAAAVTNFNAEAAAYQTRNAQHRQLQQQIAQAEAELNAMLEQRSRANAAQAATAKKVTMYTTSHCPACVMAKQYFAKKGVTYEEVDVERSQQGMQDFRKLGGSGVPLIIIGNTRMQGFNSKAIDDALKAG